MEVIRAGPLAPKVHLNPDLSLFGWSTLDWCEQNYVVVSSVAEFWNTASGCIMVVLAVVGIRFCCALGLEMRFKLAFVGLLLIGIGTCVFHATLTYAGQLLDELPMIWATCVFVYCAAKPLVTGMVKDRYLRLALSCYATFVSILYVTVFKNLPTFLEASYGALVASLIMLTCKSIAGCPEKSRPLLWRLFASALGPYIGGFAIWNVENLFCGQVLNLQDRFGSVSSVLFQLHAWWHLAQVGTYIAIVLLILVDYAESDSVSVSYFCGCIPVVTRASTASLMTLKSKKTD